MHIRAIAVALPVPGHYFVLHSHTEQRFAVWTADDRAKFDQLVTLVDNVYSRTGALDNLDKESRDAIFLPTITKEEALQRLVPYVLGADRVRKDPQFLEHERDYVSVLGLAGVDSREFGLRHVVISRGAPFSPEPWLIERFARATRQTLGAYDAETQQSLPLGQYRSGHDLHNVDTGQIINTSTLDFRSNLRLVTLVRQHRLEAQKRGTLKVVIVPSEIEIKLTANKGGEVVRQIAEEWS